MKIRTIIAILLPFLLISCSNELNLKKVCQESNGLCENLPPDAMCKVLRKDVIISNYHYEKEKDTFKKDYLKYKLLNDLESFESCSKKATYIEYVNPREKFAKQDLGRTKPLTEKENLEMIY